MYLAGMQQPATFSSPHIHKMAELPNSALGNAFDEARALLLDRFSAVTLAELSADFHARMLASGMFPDKELTHAV